VRGVERAGVLCLPAVAAHTCMHLATLWHAAGGIHCGAVSVGKQWASTVVLYQ